jgi:hypothetical protein
MSEFALAVERSTARLVGFDGSSATATLFLRGSSPRGPRPESVAERLNSLDGEFLPCEVDGEISIVNLAWIAYVECPTQEPVPAEPGLRRAPAELDLITGETLAGQLTYVARPGRARVSDLLNSASDRFLLLASPGLERHVRRTAILRVRS